MIKKQAKKVAEKTQTGISRGLGLSILTEGGRYINETIRGFFTIPKAGQKETFTQAMQRMQLSQADLDKQIKRYWQQLALFILCSLVTLGYMLYMFMDGAIGSGIVAFLGVLLFLTYALRAHFWIFQIKNRKLGCTWQEWWNNKIIPEEESTKIVIKK